MSDEELMARVGAGDEAAFRLLAARHLPRVVALARRVIGNDADAEEVAQEALLRVWLNAPRWRPTAAFRTWLYRVVVNLCLNRLRRAPFAAIEDGGDPRDTTPNPAERAESRELERQVDLAISRLPKRQRAAIVLTYHQDMTNAEAAVVLGTSVSGVESLLVRAKRSLFDALASHLDVVRKDEK